MSWLKILLSSLEKVNLVLYIGGLSCRHLGGKNKRNFVHKVCIKMAMNSQRRKILLFLSTIMATVTSHANHQLSWKREGRSYESS